LNKIIKWPYASTDAEAGATLPFLKKSREGVDELSNLLEVYCQASGQRINKDKLSIFFTKGCPHAV
jgi:hypothetical protein